MRERGIISVQTVRTGLRQCAGKAPRIALGLLGSQNWQGAKSATRNPLKARQSCNPPQSAIRLQAFGA
eukprot:8484844-Alexandrium_andersonii.AAC.1